MPDQKRDDIHDCFYLKAAENLGLDYEILDEEKGLFSIATQARSIRGCRGVLTVDAPLRKAFANDKYLTIQLLARHGMPVPNSELFELGAGAPAVLAATSNPFPLVTKPIRGTSGDGVTTNIMSEHDLAAAMETIRRLLAERPQAPASSRFILENHVSGGHYRIFMCRGKIMGIIRRTPACVVGDAKSTIRQLIRQKNADRTKCHASMNLTFIDSNLIDFLAVRDESPETVPAANEEVVLRQICNVAGGGDVHQVALDGIAPDNISLFLEIQEIMKLEICGIDFITPDITQSHRDMPCCVNEVNPTPGIQLHCWSYPDPIKLDVAEAVLSRCFQLADSETQLAQLH